MDEGVHGDKNVGNVDVCCGPFAAVAAAEAWADVLLLFRVRASSFDPLRVVKCRVSRERLTS